MKFDTIYVDPAWTFKTYSDLGKGKSPEKHYKVMTLEDMKALPIPDLLADNAAVFMWCTWPTIFQAGELGAAWGLTYKTNAFLWCKLNKKPHPEILDPKDNAHWFFGLGYWSRANSEPCLLFTKGKPKRKAKNVRQLIVSPIQQHSQKPEEAYGRIEALTGSSYLELFARNTRPGWVSLGNDIDGRDLRDSLPLLAKA